MHFTIVLYFLKCKLYMVIAFNPCIPEICTLWYRYVSWPGHLLVIYNTQLLNELINLKINIPVTNELRSYRKIFHPHQLDKFKTLKVKRGADKRKGVFFFPLLSPSWVTLVGKGGTEVKMRTFRVKGTWIQILDIIYELL